MVTLAVLLADAANWPVKPFALVLKLIGSLAVSSRPPTSNTAVAPTMIPPGL